MLQKVYQNWSIWIELKKKKTLINRILNLFYHLKSQLQLKHVTHNTWESGGNKEETIFPPSRKPPLRLNPQTPRLLKRWKGEVESKVEAKAAAVR